MKPIQCHLWNSDVSMIAQLADFFTVIQVYAEDSHLSRSLVKCKQCDQLYAKDFYEEVDWVDGEDSQRWTYVPVEHKEDAEELARLDSIAGASPSLHEDFLKGEKKKVYWVGKD